MEKIHSVPLFFYRNEEISDRNTTPYEVQKKFGAMLHEALNHVNQSQLEANKQTEKLINNESYDLHNVMIAAEKAAVTMQVTLEIRNKAIEAYQEIMRMPL